ncbi:hypothetical protein A2U01_0052827, partial [Trifolium medium]|nr:hypothetical protein [Trifolium medium]
GTLQHVVAQRALPRPASMPWQQPETCLLERGTFWNGARPTRLCSPNEEPCTRFPKMLSTMAAQANIS